MPFPFTDSPQTKKRPAVVVSSAGLTVPSIIRQKLFTLDSRLIIKKVGFLEKEDRKAVSHLLQEHISLPS